MAAHVDSLYRISCSLQKGQEAPRLKDAACGNCLIHSD